MTSPIPGLLLPNFLPIPNIVQLAAWSGRSQQSYGPFANTALFRATFKFSVTTQLWLPDWNGLPAEAQSFATLGILAYADNLYLSQPYQQVVANPFNNETIGSYSYAKAQSGGGSMSRMIAPAMELKMEATGVDEFDWAVRLLAKRTEAAGVYTGGITVFEDGSLRYDGVELMVDDMTGRVVLFGPQDHNLIDAPMFDVNSEAFPADPGG